jgi:RNA polymerase sigma factor for flagellar operon FliA
MTSSPRTPAKPSLPAPATGSTPPAPSSAKASADSPTVLARVREHLPLVDIIAKQIRRQLGARVMLDELVSFGREGLLGAARTFDDTLGVPFHRWANYRVRGAMLDGVRSSSMLPRSVYQRLRALDGAHHTSEAVAEDGSVTRPASPDEADARLGSYLAGIATAVALGLFAAPADGSGSEGIDPAPAADEVLGRQETLAVVREALAELPEQERHLIQRHYFDDVRLDEAAREIGLSKSWASRIHGRAIESIGRQMKRSKVAL